MKVYSDNKDNIARCRKALTGKIEEAYDKTTLKDDVVKSLTTEEVSSFSEYQILFLRLSNI